MKTIRKKQKRVIPGFGLSLGFTITVLSIVVLIPLASLVIYTSRLSLREIIETITRGRVLASFFVSFLTAFIASLINAVMGVLIAWVLVRYEFPGKRFMDGLIELPYIKWALLYGIVLCTARAMGEFGAVSVLSGHLRGKTNTLPLHVEILFNEFHYVEAFGVSSILVILSVIILILRSVIEGKRKIRG